MQIDAVERNAQSSADSRLREIQQVADQAVRAVGRAFHPVQNAPLGGDMSPRASSVVAMSMVESGLRKS
jgi:hypothetical protein